MEDALPSRPGNALWIPVVMIALLSMPMMVTSRTFGHDWTLHLRLIRQQQLNIEAMSHPGLFVSVSRLGVFYPIFAFVGSGLYTAGACSRSCSATGRYWLTSCSTSSASASRTAA